MSIQIPNGLSYTGCLRPDFSHQTGNGSIFEFDARNIYRLKGFQGISQILLLSIKIKIVQFVKYVATVGVSNLSRIDLSSFLVPLPIFEAFFLLADSSN